MTRRELWSGIAFGLAGLTRPEAPLFVGILFLVLGPRQLWRTAAVFSAIVGAHLLWRHWYYGAWIPNTFAAKTGDLAQQVNAGGWYVRVYLLERLGAVGWLAVMGFCLACYERLRVGIAFGLMAGAWVVYVVLIGGDWMPCSRHMAIAEPFVFLLVDMGARHLWSKRTEVGAVAIAGWLLLLAPWARVADMRRIAAEFPSAVSNLDVFGALAWYTSADARPGSIALGDIGRIGWVTDRPIVDLDALIDPEGARLSRGAARGAHVILKSPEYVQIASTAGDCEHPFYSPTEVAMTPWLAAHYRMVRRIPQGPQGVQGDARGWCIWEKV